MLQMECFKKPSCNACQFNVSRFAKQSRVDPAAERSAGRWGDPEHPQLLQRPTTDEEGWATLPLKVAREIRAFEQSPVDPAAERSPDERGDPEHPELL